MTRKLGKAQTSARSSTVILKGTTRFFPAFHFCSKSSSHSVVLQNVQHQTLQFCCWLQPLSPNSPQRCSAFFTPCSRKVSQHAQGWNFFKSKDRTLPARAGFSNGTAHDQARSTSNPGFRHSGKMLQGPHENIGSVNKFTTYLFELISYHSLCLSAQFKGRVNLKLALIQHLHPADLS